MKPSFLFLGHTITTGCVIEAPISPVNLYCQSLCLSDLIVVEAPYDVINTVHCLDLKERREYVCEWT